MIIFYSGEGSKSNPEITLQNDACLMLTFEDMFKRAAPDRRFKQIIKARKRRAKQVCVWCGKKHKGGPENCK